MSSYQLERLSDALEAELSTFRFHNREGEPTRSRYLSLAITDLESAQNWVQRAILEASVKESLDEESD